MRVVPQRKLEAFASSTRDIPVGSSLFSMELRPEPTAEKKTVSDRPIPSPHPALSPRERENHSAHLERPSAPRRSVVQVKVSCRGAELRCVGSKSTFPER